MDPIRQLAITLLVFIGLSHAKKPGNNRQSEEERLLGYLFRRYNPSARPVINSSHTVPVKIMYSMMHIQELNVKTQILTATGLLILEWTDERLRWDIEDFGLTEIVVEAKLLWVPEFAVINGADEIYGDYNEFRAIVTNTGIVRWEPGGVFKTMCEIDITYFPFDDQTCALVFGAWSYHTTKMNLTNSSDRVNLDSYERNGEWEVITTQVFRDEFSYACCPDERFSNVAFTLHLRRRYTFYVMNVILPSMVTSILLLSIFYCPPGQKVQIGVVVLLSFRIFLLNVTDSIPKTSDHIPLLGIYLTCTMAITTLSMVLTVLVLNLHSITERPVPHWIRVVVLEYLAKLFCRCDDHSSTPSPSTGQNGQYHDPHGQYTDPHGQYTDAHASHAARNKKQRKVLHHANPLHTELDPDTDTEQVPIITMNGARGLHGNTETTSFVFLAAAQEHNHNIQKNEYYVQEPEKKPDYSKDWQRLAEIVDRLFFWAFLLAIIAISLLLFHPLTKEYIHPTATETPTAT